MLICDFYLPFSGGSSLQASFIAHGMVDRGHEVHIVTTWHSGLEEKEVTEGVTIHRIKALVTRVPWFSSDPNRRFPPPFPDPGLVSGIGKLVREFKPDVIHAQGWTAYSAAGTPESKGIPLVVSLYDYGYSCATRTLMYKGRACDGPALAKCIQCAKIPYGYPKAVVSVLSILGERGLLRRRVDAFHTESAFVTEILQRDILQENDTNHIEVIPGFRNTNETGLGEIDPSWEDQLPDEPYILFVGALTPDKGLFQLLDAYAQLKNQPRLLLIGAVWHNSPDSFPDGVTIMRDVPHNVVMEGWKRAMFGVAPSVWPEPFGNVVHEAQSQGTPIIGTYPGGHPDMITDMENGLLVPAGDTDALRDAMQKLIDDADLRERLGQAAAISAVKYQSDVTIPQFEALYKHVLENNDK